MLMSNGIDAFRFETAGSPTLGIRILLKRGLPAAAGYNKIINFNPSSLFIGISIWKSAISIFSESEREEEILVKICPIIII